MNTAQMLCEYKAEIKIIKYGQMPGLTVLHQAVESRNYEIVAYLIKHDAQVNVIDEDSGTPLSL